jgi:membrane dipeptidase
MDCCAHALPRRGSAWRARLGAAGAMFSTGARSQPAAAATTAADEALAAARRLLDEHVSVDVHSHAGPTGIGSRNPPSDELARGMRAGHIAVVCLADVPDGPILGRGAGNVLEVVRDPEPGQLYRHHLDRLAWTDTLVERHGIGRVLSPADLGAAHAAGAPAIIMDVEGLDFLEGKLERLEESYGRGVRTMQLVHYTPNDIGDFQTGAVVHGGLTPFGADVIRACNALGVVIDVAHGTEDLVRQAVRVAARPLLLSHTALRGSKAQGPTALTGRQITPDHARAIAETGGTIGIWHFFDTLERYVDGLREMVDVVGVNHVSIGTDTAARGGLFAQYDDYTRLVDAILRGGFTPADAAKIIGGNYVRIFEASVREGRR